MMCNLLNKSYRLLLWVVCFMTLSTVSGWSTNVWDGDRTSDFKAEGSGTPGDPYLIRTGSQLANLCDAVNDGSFTSNGRFISLEDNIDLNNLNWTPIGTYTRHFYGNFNGKGKIISNVTVQGTGSGVNGSAGLFGFTNGATIEKLGVVVGEAGIIGGTDGVGGFAGGLVASPSGGTTIRSCQVEGTAQALIKSPRAAGGIAGITAGAEIIEDCFSDCPVEGVSAGGIVGEISGSGEGIISYCYSRGTITATSDAGGIVGKSYASAVLVSCLALNRTVNGTGQVGRVIGDKGSVTLAGNYGNANMPVNGVEVNGAVDDEQGATLNQANFIENNDIAFSGWGIDASEWIFYRQDALPQLKPFVPTSSTPRSYFVKATFAVEIRRPVGGTITGKFRIGNDSTEVVGGQTYRIPEGAVLSLKATPLPGATFESFQVVGGNTYTRDTVDINITRAATIMATFRGYNPPVPPVPPIVWHKVSAPATKGVLFVRNGMEKDSILIDVLEEGSLTFHIKLMPDYIAPNIKVTTSRGEVLRPHDADKKYTLFDVREAISIKVEGVHPTGNEAIDTDNVRVWTSQGQLHIQAPAGEAVHIVTFAGALVRQLTTTGSNMAVSLAPGAYIIRVGKQSVKVNL